MLKKMSPVLWALAPLLVLAPALTCVAPRAMAAIYIACGVFTVGAYTWQNRALPALHKGWLYAVGAFTGYGVLSFLWTINPHDTIGKSIELGGIFLLSGFLHAILNTLDADARARIGKMLGLGFVLGLALYTFEYLFNYPLYNLIRGGASHDVVDVKQNKAVFVLALWAALAYPYFSTRRPACVAGAVALAAATFVSQSMSSQLILAGVPLLVAALYILPVRVNLRLTLIACVALVTLMPSIAMQAYKVVDLQDRNANGSITSRIEIWNQTSQRIRERPLLGWGMDSASEMPNRDEISVIPAYRELHRKIAHLHPHNAPLQIWFEAGGAGIAALCAFFIFLYTRIEALGQPSAQRYAITVWVTGFLYTLSIWGIWQSWFVASLALAAVFGALGTKQLRQP